MKIYGSPRIGYEFTLGLFECLILATYLKLALCRSLPPRVAGTLPDRELPLRFLHEDFFNRNF